MSAPLRHPVIPAAEARQETAPPAKTVVHLDLTLIDRLPRRTVTLDNFVEVVGTATARSESKYLNGDDTAHRRAWEGKW